VVEENQFLPKTEVEATRATGFSSASHHEQQKLRLHLQQEDEQYQYQRQEQDNNSSGSPSKPPLRSPLLLPPAPAQQHASQHASQSASTNLFFSTKAASSRRGSGGSGNLYTRQPEVVVDREAQEVDRAQKALVSGAA